jgi:hypothetical protein
MIRENRENLSAKPASEKCLGGISMLFLYGKAFRLSFGEAFATVLDVAVARAIVQFPIGTLVARLS